MHHEHRRWVLTLSPTGIAWNVLQNRPCGCSTTFATGSPAPAQWGGVLLTQKSPRDRWSRGYWHFTDWLVDSKLSGERGGTGQLSVDLLTDIHPGCQSKIHAIGTINELLKLHIGYPLANFPDAIGRPLWPNRTKRMVEETSFKIVGDCLIPSTTRWHCCLCCLPPLLSLTSTELVMNVEKLRSHCRETLLQHPRVNAPLSLLWAATRSTDYHWWCSQASSRCSSHRKKDGSGETWSNAQIINVSWQRSTNTSRFQFRYGKIKAANGLIRPQREFPINRPDTWADEECTPC